MKTAAPCCKLRFDHVSQSNVKGGSRGDREREMPKSCSFIQMNSGKTIWKEPIEVEFNSSVLCRYRNSSIEIDDNSSEHKIHDVRESQSNPGEEHLGLLSSFSTISSAEIRHNSNAEDDCSCGNGCVCCPSASGIDAGGAPETREIGVLIPPKVIEVGDKYSITDTYQTPFVVSSQKVHRQFLITSTTPKNDESVEQGEYDALSIIDCPQAPLRKVPTTSSLFRSDTDLECLQMPSLDLEVEDGEEQEQKCNYKQHLPFVLRHRISKSFISKDTDDDSIQTPPLRSLQGASFSYADEEEGYHNYVKYTDCSYAPRYKESMFTSLSDISDGDKERLQLPTLKELPSSMKAVIRLRPRFSFNFPDRKSVV